MQSGPGRRSALRVLLSRPRGSGEAPVRPLWRTHLVVVRTSDSPLSGPLLAERVSQADPFALPSCVGDDRVEVDVWVEAADAGAAVRCALRAWADLAALAAPPEAAAADGWEVVGLDLARADGVAAATPARPPAPTQR